MMILQVGFNNALPVEVQLLWPTELADNSTCQDLNQSSLAPCFSVFLLVCSVYRCNCGQSELIVCRAWHAATCMPCFFVCPCLVLALPVRSFLNAHPRNSRGRPSRFCISCSGEKWPPEFCKLLTDCMAQDPKDRPPMSEVGHAQVTSLLVGHKLSGLYALKRNIFK
eukprot:1055382-Pelagomonas_calceolata.AAC.2